MSYRYDNILSQVEKYVKKIMHENHVQLKVITVHSKCIVLQ